MAPKFVDASKGLANTTIGECLGTDHTLTETTMYLKRVLETTGISSAIISGYI
jgi:hypothetical protein